MPLQNRVTPFGELIAVPARGTFMGNRGGVIHDNDRRIVRHYASRRWIACVLEFKGRKRVVMTPRRYTELFFLDDAVALAAGHRPCAECRRARFNAFKEAWGGGRVLADEMDRQLHAARIDERKAKVTYRERLDLLPNGCFVEKAGAAHLVWNDGLLRWTADGYAGMLERPADVEVSVLTPRPIVECLRRGYVPEVHGSVGEGAR